jgi:hypothetical protein
LLKVADILAGECQGYCDAERPAEVTRSNNVTSVMRFRWLARNLIFLSSLIFLKLIKTRSKGRKNEPRSLDGG